MRLLSRRNACRPGSSAGFTCARAKAARVSTLPTAPDEAPAQRAPRAVVGALIGAELGAATGLLFMGHVPLAPLGFAAAGAMAGPFAAKGAGSLRTLLVGRWLRAQVRRAHRPAPETAKR